MNIYAIHATVMAVAAAFNICHPTVAFINIRAPWRRCQLELNRYLSGCLSVKMATTYQVSTCSDNPKWIRVSFSDADNTTIGFDAKKASQHPQQSNLTTMTSIPESVLQYERQLRKIQASDRASKTNVTIEDHLKVVHVDKDLVITNKPSGLLCVPGVNKYRSLLDLVYETYGSGSTESIDENIPAESLQKDSMIVHRLDMDTSGIVAFARTRLAMSKLHEAFRERTGTKKMYEALLVGWLDMERWSSAATNTVDQTEVNMTIHHDTDLGWGEINLPLQRDHKHPPFMRVSTPESEMEAHQAVKDLNHAGWKKIVAKKAKPSTTQFTILSHEEWNGYPVTRVALTPITGRTHQLRVHCAALGHPILGDPAYGFCGEAHPNGGFLDETLTWMSPTCANVKLRRDVEERVRENGRTMCLHARMLGLVHPATGEAVTFEVLPPF